MQKPAIERVVALLTPLFAVAAGAISTGVGSATGIPKSDYIALFVTGATAAAGAAYKWVHGRQLFIKAQSDVEMFAGKVKDAIKADPPAALALADVESVLRAHTAQIVQAIGSAVHAPPSVDEVAKQIMAGIVSGGAPAPAAPVAAPSSGGGLSGPLGTPTGAAA